MGQDNFLELLREQHTFPGPFTFRVVVRPGSEPLVTSALNAVGTLVVREVSHKASRKGNYLSLRLVCRSDRAECVAEAYEVLHALDDVLMTL